jgi:NTP pyrophosphatase (non-canonical NTP hydrolase)
MVAIMSENQSQYDTHAHSQDDPGKVPYWKRAVVTDGDYRQLLASATFKAQFDLMAKAVREVNTANGFTADDGTFLAKLSEEVNEVGEALECENPGTLVMELADVIIAVMFYAAENNLPLGEAIESKNTYNATRGWLHGKGEK